MKRAFTLMLLAFVAAPGCLSMNPFAKAPAPKEAPKPIAPPAVLADEITPENARKKADALNKELDYDAGGMTPTPAATTSAPKP